MDDSNVFKGVPFSDVDFEILEYINKHAPIEPDDVLKKFPEAEYYTVYRLFRLESTFIILGKVAGNPKTRAGCYSLVPTGAVALNNWQHLRRKERQKYFAELAKLTGAASFGYVFKTLLDIFLK